MPSSISSSERPGLLVRATASDRPGVAQPVPERAIPHQPWHRISLIALGLLALLLVGWELYWRSQGLIPGYRNEDQHWTEQRRRIDNGEGNHTVLIGSSRVLYDVALDVWQDKTGERPIQLSLEGTSGVLLMENLAADPAFTGKLLVGVAPDVFFNGGAFRKSALDLYSKEGPSQRFGHWLSKTLLEPYIASYDGDYSLSAILDRQYWPLRPGTERHYSVPKLANQLDVDRNMSMWSKLETDPEYRQYARDVWASFLKRPPRGYQNPAQFQAKIDAEIARAVKAANTLRARGVKIVFVRPPVGGQFYTFENQYYPRATSWDRLLERTGLPGIYYEDYPELRETDIPEWSHLSASAARHFTAGLAPLVAEKWRSQ